MSNYKLSPVSIVDEDGSVDFGIYIEHGDDVPQTYKLDKDEIIDWASEMLGYLRANK